MAEPSKTAGQAQTLKGNQVLRLDDPSAVWVVESGKVALFGVVLENGAPHGPRHYFFSSGPGEALFGFPAAGADDRSTVIAVSLEQTTLRKLDADCVPDGPGPGETRGELVARWVESWTRCVGPIPDAPGRPPGEPEASPSPSADSLARFHQILLRHIDDLESRETREEHARLRARELRAREVAGQAVAELTSVLEPGRERLAHGSDLFVAAHAVGRALGITLRAPAAWETDETTADPVELIARASHVRVRKVVLHDSWWKQDCGPLLGFSGPDRRPLALLPETPGSYRSFDPATDTRRPVDERVASALDTHAYVFYQPLPEQPTQGLELLRFALRGRGRDLATVLATAIAATLLGMFTPQATALLVDHAIPDADRRLLVQLGLGLAAAALGAAVFRLAQGIAMLRVETAADAVAQSAVWDRLLNLQLSFFRRFSTGDLQSRVTAVSQIRNYLGGATLRTLFGSVILLLNLGLLLYYSPMLTLVAVGVALISCTVTVGSGVMILRYSRQILEFRGRFFGFMVQLVNGIAKLRVAAAEDRAFARWAEQYARLLRLELRQRRIQDAVAVINIGVSTLSAIVLFAIVASLIRPVAGGAGLTTGVFLAFHVAYGTFIGAIATLSNTVTDVMAIAILRERVRPILEASPEVNERKASPGRLEGRVDLEHVVFHYREDGPVILDGLSLSVRPGEFVALVGPSGSGKSTLFRLLLGFETPQSGCIYYDGQDLAGLDVYAVRRQMGVVLQNGRINAGSIFDNVASGADVSLNEAWEAARAAAFDEEISAMPMGMHTVISEGGTNLSGGQRQRLLLTRALMHRPRILLLDEATSALDNWTQAIVNNSLKRLQVTRIVIAHRLSTVRQTDRIYVVDSGRIIQQGVFEDLARERGLFARLMARQSA